jgi:nitroimidazol reductase NimA-like FMN-containing flavoprotein (pyridoxamine 5'-phosphate oxidase superfamily)
MTVETPTAELAPQFSSPEARPVAWEEARGRLEQAEVYWLSTVRPAGSPHVTPLIAVWVDGALVFCTGADERKAKNVARNRQVVLTTGCNTLHEGFDVVVEGDAVRVRGDDRLQLVADEYLSKYGEEWRFTVRDGAFINPEGGEALVYEVRPKTRLRLRQGRAVQPDALALLTRDKPAESMRKEPR